ncbi:MAG: tetratricopeptide repeat protein [Bacteroidales bacterium]
MKRLLLVGFFWIVNIGLAEASLPDSLLNRIARIEPQRKMAALIEFGNRMLTSHPALAEEAGLMAWKLTHSLDDLRLKREAAFWLGKYYQSTGSDFKKAAYYYKKSVSFSSSDNPRMLADVMMQLASSYLFEKSMDSARYYAQRAAYIYRQIPDEESYVTARLLAGNIFLEIKQVDSAISNFALSADALENLIKVTVPDAPKFKQYLTRMAEIKSMLAHTWLLKGNYRVATAEINKALAHAVLAGNKYLHLHLSLDYADIYARQGIYEKSLEVLFRMLKDYEKQDDANVLAEIWQRIGVIYASLGEMEKSQQNLRKSVELLNSAGNVAATAAVYAVMGDGYYNDRKYDTAEVYYRKSFEINRKFENLRGIMEDLVRLGNLAIAQGKLNDAETFFGEILRQGTTHDSTLMASAWKGIAQLNLRKGHLSEAIYFAQKTYQHAEGVGDLNSLVEMANLLAEAFAATGDYKNAYQWQRVRSAWYDSLNLIGHKKEITRLQARYDFEKKEAELTLEKEKSRNLARTQRLILYFSVLGILLVVIIARLLYNREKERRLTESLNYRREAELARTRQALMEVEVKAQELEQKQLKEDLRKQSAHLTNLAIIIAQKNEFINQLKDQIKNLRQAQGQEKDKCMADLIHQINHQQRLNADLDHFRKEVEVAHQNFYKRLAEICPSLTSHDKDLAGLLRIGLSSKDIASFNNVSVKAVEMSRYRLRKKLNLSTDESLVDFLQNLS